jgi:hypothetical protein
VPIIGIVVCCASGTELTKRIAGVTQPICVSGWESDRVAVWAIGTVGMEGSDVLTLWETIVNGHVLLVLTECQRRGWTRWACQLARALDLLEAVGLLRWGKVGWYYVLAVGMGHGPWSHSWLLFPSNWFSVLVPRLRNVVYMFGNPKFSLRKAHTQGQQSVSVSV